MKILLLCHGTLIDVISTNILEHNLIQYFDKDPLAIDLVYLGKKKELLRNPFFNESRWNTIIFIDHLWKSIKEISTLRKQPYDLYIGTRYSHKKSILANCFHASKKITNKQVPKNKRNTTKRATEKGADVLTQIQAVLKEIAPEKKMLVSLPKVFYNSTNSPNKNNVISWMFNTESNSLLEDSKRIFIYFYFPKAHRTIFTQIIPEILNAIPQITFLPITLILENDAAYWNKQLEKKIHKNAQNRLEVHYLKVTDQSMLLPLINNAKIIISNNKSLMLFSQLLGKKNLLLTPKMKFKSNMINAIHYRKKGDQLKEKSLNEIHYLLKHLH